MTNKDKINLMLIGATGRTNETIASIVKAFLDHEDRIINKNKMVCLSVPGEYETGLLEQMYLDKEQAHKLIIYDEANIKIKNDPWESVSQSLIEFGLKAAGAAKGLIELTKLSCFNYQASRFGDPWAPLHGIQARFFRFDPKKWHDRCVKLAPVISNHAIYFYRRCWMHAKTFMNVKLEELEELEVVV